MSSVRQCRRRPRLIFLQISESLVLGTNRRVAPGFKRATQRRPDPCREALHLQTSNHVFYKAVPSRTPARPRRHPQRATAKLTTWRRVLVDCESCSAIRGAETSGAPHLRGLLCQHHELPGWTSLHDGRI